MNIELTYLTIAWFATILFVIKMAIFMLTGGDTEVHADFQDMTDYDTSFNFLSVQSLLAFFMGFGWMGLTALKQLKYATSVTVILSVVVGLIFMIFAAYLMFVIKKLEKRIVVKYEDYIGTEGKSYTNFNPKSKGQIQIIINNRLETLEAVNISEQSIEAFQPIKLVKVENNILYIDLV